MHYQMAERVYDTLSGFLTEEYCVSGVHNAFEGGSTCSNLYEKVMEAYSRLCDRLSVIDEDSDVEQIINSLLEMNKILCLEMFSYGVKFANLSFTNND